MHDKVELMSEPLLHIKQIKVRYSGLPVIHGVSLAVYPGETVCVVGSNGAGKSTILRAVMGSQRAFDGEILCSLRPGEHYFRLDGTPQQLA